MEIVNKTKEEQRIINKAKSKVLSSDLDVSRLSEGKVCFIALKKFVE